VKRVVFVGADFVPSSLPPALRIRLFVRHLPAFGWEPTVLTTRPEYYEGAVDGENERLLPPGLTVVRTAALPARLARRLGFGDIGMRSLWHHWRALAALCRRGAVDLVCIPVPPSVPMVLGRLAHRRFGVPYVVDYIDPWVTEYYWKLPRAQRPPKWRLAYTLARVLEPIALRRVGHVTGVSRGTTAQVIARCPWLSPADTTEIPYGGEPADFAYLRTRGRRAGVFDPADGLLHVSYVGACVPAMHRTLRAIFAAVREGLRRDPARFERLRLHFVGTSYAPDAEGRYQVRAMAEAAGVAERVDERPARVPYLTALQVLLDSQALLVVGSDEPHYTASKVFPYVLSQRPIVAVCHEASGIVPVLRETGAGCVVTFGEGDSPEDHVEAIVAGLADALAQPPDRPVKIGREAFEPYTARTMAGRLAGAFDRALGRPA
jgi:hypothetical protein